MVPILSFYGYVIGTAGGYAVATFGAGLTHFTYMNSVELFTEVGDIVYA